MSCRRGLALLVSLSLTLSPNQVAMSVSAITALLISSVDSVKVHDRLIVLGPHHTGTSIVAKALDGYGFYLGDAKDLLLRQDNPLKYWERRDVVALNDARISSAGLDRTDVPSFVGYGYEPTQGLPLDPSPIVEILDGGGKSWATKDPRLSLTAAPPTSTSSPSAGRRPFSGRRSSCRCS